MENEQAAASSAESRLKNIHIGMPVYCCTEEDATALRDQDLKDVRVCNTNGCDFIAHTDYAAVSTLIAECPQTNTMRSPTSSLIYICSRAGFVLKKFARNFLDSTKPHLIKYSAREVDISLRLRHENIGSPLGIYVQQNGGAYLITGLVFEHHGTELRHYIRENRGDGIIKTSTIVKIATQIASALQFMHDQVPPVIHRDVKPDKILVSEIAGNPHVKLIGYGLSRAEADLMTANLTEHYYTAPEIFATKEETSYTATVDIYSFGMVMYFMTVGKNPFERTNEQGKTIRIRGFINYINSSNEDGNYPRPEFYATYEYPESLKKLIEGCWKHSPEERLRWDQINSILKELA